MKLKLALITSLISLVTTTSFSQTGKIIGSIKDGGYQQIIDAATVYLLKAKDSAILKTSVTDKTGNFSFENIKDGAYLVMATSVGHSKTYSVPMSVSSSSTVSTGILQLVPVTKTLKEVSVTNTKPFIERKIDKTILNVDAMISNAGTTAMEVLEKAPGVSVDKDGNISLKGKQGVIIMIDGKPSYLSGDQLTNLLKSMPSSVIDQVEIMTNPSAKYDASGNSGIINLRTKKSKIQGFNGSAAASYIQGVYPKFTSSANINYRRGKINVFANLSSSQWNGMHDLSITRNFRDPATSQLQTIFQQASFMRDYSENYSLKTGLDFYADKKTTLGIVLSGFINPSMDHGDNTTYLKDGNGIVDSIVYATNSQNRNSKNFGANFNFRHVFDSTQKELTADLDYIVYDQSSGQLFTNNYLNADMTKRRASSELSGDLPANVKIYSAKMDYSMPVKKSGKFEAGIKSSYVVTDNNAIYNNNTGSGWVPDYTKTNHFIYNENINAAYANFNMQLKKWSFQTGLRAENTIANGHQIGNISRADSSFSRNYTNLFPTVYVSYEADKKNQFSINYGRRIDRPRYQDLNPFYYFLDEYTYEVGNTLLKPQFTNSIELSHTYKNFLTTTLNYSKTNDVIADVLNQISSERKTFISKQNIATQTNIGIAISASFPITKFWSTNLYGNVFNNKYYGAVNSGILDVNSTMFMTNINNQFKFKKGWSAELSGYYRSKGIEGQIIADPMWQATTAVQKQVLKTKGTVKLSFNDIFNSQKFSGSVKYQDIDVTVKNKNDTRRVSLTFSYRFGKPMQNQQRRKTGGASDEENRVKN